MQEYFLGGSTPTGFRTHFSDVISKDGYYTYILKGGPGTGKSTLMKKVAKHFRDCNVITYRCSSDINSLDAVVIEDKKIIIVDGTSPHVFDPIYPGVSQEIINLGSFWNKDALQKNGKAVQLLSDENQKCHRTVKRYIKAISSINSDICRHAENSLDRQKLSAYIQRLSKKLIPSKNNIDGRREFNQLSSLTQEKYMTLPVNEEYSKYFIKDDFFAGGNFFLRKLADTFTENGYDITVSECNMLDAPTYEHLICHKLKLVFITGNFMNGLTPETENVINFTRFYDKELLSSKKQRMNFNKKAVAELISETAECLTTALKIHDKLEKYYINALDFEKLEKMTDDFIKTLE
ncbi:MAG: hypothetical protein IJA12_04170 [Oscillospiraceae bacterium]|nr:hypothetical protein [Oscillospiraceae bacterium]